MVKIAKKTAGVPTGRIDGANCKLGGAVAENEADLLSVYLDNSYLEAARDPSDRRCFFIGRTGTGKSAILKMVREQYSPQHVLSLTASEFTFRDIDLREFIVELAGNGVNLDYLFKVIWKYLLVVALLKKRFPDLKERKSWLQQSLMTLTNSAKKAAYDFLLASEELHGQRTFPERLAAMLDTAEVELKLAVGNSESSSVHGSAKAKATFSGAQSPGARTQHGLGGRAGGEVGGAIQRALERSWSISKLHDVIDLLSDDILVATGWWVLIDDLDKAFAESPLSKTFVKCLFEVIMEFQQKVRQLKFVVALRTDIFDQLKFYQREKVDQFVYHMNWTPAQLRLILEQRVRFCIQVPESKKVYGSFFPVKVRTVNGGDEETFEFLRSRSLDRPRDIIAFASDALEKCVGDTSVSASALRDVEPEYSRGRLNALTDEWQEVYPCIDEIMRKFEGGPATLSPTELAGGLSDFLCEAVDSEERCEPGDKATYCSMLAVTSDSDVLVPESPDAQAFPLPVRKLASYLWHTGAIERRKSSGGQWASGAGTNRLIEFNDKDLIGHMFRVHPMLRAGLEIQPGGR